MSLRPLLDDVLSFYFQVKSLDHRSMQKHELLLMEEILHHLECINPYT